MGEKQDDKEKKQQKKEGGDEKEDKKPQGDGGGEKKNKKEDGGGGGGPITVVLKIDLHCEGCAKKVRRCASAFEGVEKVTMEMESGKVTLVGKVDAWKLKDRLEVKTHKKVVLVSPTDPPKKKDNKGGEGKKKEDKKPDKPKEITVALKILLHCDGCIQRIRRNIIRFKGVEGVTVDAQKDLVLVRGFMDVKAMVPYLRVKLRRGVEVVAPKEGGGGDKKDKKEGGGGGEKGEKKGGDGAEKGEKKGGGGGEKKEEGGGGDGGEKKEKKEKKEGGGDGGGEGKVEVGKMEQYYCGGVGGYCHYPQLMYAPQMFSDENPNACSVM